MRALLACSAGLRDDYLVYYHGKFINKTLVWRGRGDVAAAGGNVAEYRGVIVITVKLLNTWLAVSITRDVSRNREALIMKWAREAGGEIASVNIA